jgi:hypothetical protein
MRLAGAIAISLLVASAIAAQWGGWGRRMPPKYPGPDYQSEGSFTFCRVEYEQVEWEPLGHGWNTDYPDSDINLMTRLSELTKAPIRRDQDGRPDHMVVRLTDDELFEHPFVFMSDPGTAGFDPTEAANLRRYLLRGGFLYVDDFWGERAWWHWAHEIAKALPPDDYPIVDLELDHPLFDTLFTLTEVPQIPSIQHWYRSGGTTSERGAESAVPHLRGIFDHDGRLMVLMSHNTDIADGWEREGESKEFFELFSLTKAYPLGINIVLHTLIH